MEGTFDNFAAEFFIVNLNVTIFVDGLLQLIPIRAWLGFVPPPIGVDQKALAHRFDRGFVSSGKRSEEL